MREEPRQLTGWPTRGVTRPSKILDNISVFWDRQSLRGPRNLFVEENILAIVGAVNHLSQGIWPNGRIGSHRMVFVRRLTRVDASIGVLLLHP